MHSLVTAQGLLFLSLCVAPLFVVTFGGALSQQRGWSRAGPVVALLVALVAQIVVGESMSQVGWSWAGVANTLLIVGSPQLGACLCLLALARRPVGFRIAVATAVGCALLVLFLAPVYAVSQAYSRPPRAHVRP